MERMLRAEARVDLDAIRENVALLRGRTAAELMAVVKADGYGHGQLPVARAALEAGASWLGVCYPEEALDLRAAGITAPILAWITLPGAPYREAVAAGVELSVNAPWALDEVIAAARELDVPAKVQLKADTGLHRGGAIAADWPALVGAAAKAEAGGEIQVTGVWSHLACADEPGHPSIDAQLSAYQQALAVADRAGLRPRYRHLANSAGLVTRPDTHFDLVRAGIAIYGLTPVPPHWYGLRPAMTLAATVALAKDAGAGAGVSYGHRYVTAAPTRLALVPLGYADGIPRHASNRAEVLVAGARRRIAGTVCMDQFVVDTHGDPVRTGDEVVLFGPGDRGEPTAQDWAEAAGTISYEIVTRIGPRVTRTYLGEHS
jgi:alanine racemase